MCFYQQYVNFSAFHTRQILSGSMQNYASTSSSPPVEHVLSNFNIDSMLCVSLKSRGVKVTEAPLAQKAPKDFLYV